MSLRKLQIMIFFGQNVSYTLHTTLYDSGADCPFALFSVSQSATLSLCSYLTPATMSREMRQRKHDCREMREVFRQSEAKRDREEEEEGSRGEEGRSQVFRRGCCCEQQHLSHSTHSVVGAEEGTERGRSIE